MSDSVEFWNEAYIEYVPYKIPESDFAKRNEYFLNVIGDVRGKSILDVGCGNGELSVHFALNGAKVTSIDYSETAVQNTLTNAAFHGVEVSAMQLNAMEIYKLDQTFDLAVGIFILHHLEPFGEMVESLHKVIRQDGRGVFYENNSRNKILMFFRNTVVGRFGVPKYGDNTEYPFQYRELKMAESKFPNMRLTYPQFRFFSLLAPYIFKDNVTSDRITRAMDRFIYKYLPFLNRYSYIQILDMRK